jgi:hypothetical protein
LGCANELVRLFAAGILIRRRIGGSARGVLLAAGMRLKTRLFQNSQRQKRPCRQARRLSGEFNRPVDVLFISVDTIQKNLLRGRVNNF